jgi:opacity protein-like surface antigen
MKNYVIIVGCFILPLMIRTQIYIGLNVSPVGIVNVIDNIIQSEPIYTYSLGIVTGYQFNERISSNFGINFEPKGYGGDYTFTDNTGYIISEKEAKLINSYITFPLTIRLNTFGKTKFYNDFGLYGAINIRTSYDGENISETETDDYRNFDIGVLQGLGAIFLINERVDLSLGYRLNVGLVPVFENMKNFSSRNLSWAIITMGINYKLK